MNSKPQDINSTELFSDSINDEEVVKTVLSLDEVKKLITSHSDFPKTGVTFFDIHPIMANHQARKLLADTLYERYKDQNLDAVVGLESRGYYFGLPLAERLGLPFIPVRKPKKLPPPVYSYTYNLEYGTDTIEIQTTSLKEGARVVVIDDLLATGGTAVAACTLLHKCNTHIVEFHCAMEILDLKGREKIPEGVPIFVFFGF